MKKIFSTACLIVLSLLLLATKAQAQDKLDIPFVPSPMIVVERMLQLAEIKKDDLLYDLGSGDGRIVIQAAKQYGTRGIGIDMNPELVEKARTNAEKEGVSHLVEFRAADGLTVDISQATVVTLYMFKWFNNQMRPKLQRLKPGARIVAHDFDIDEWKPTKIETVDATSDPESYFSESRTLYLWKIEAPSLAP
jgi:cyclopropane fatty-acyl-phospholipid synthase-like methyltransferase